MIRRMETGDVDAVAAIQAAQPTAAQWAADEYLGHYALVFVSDGGLQAFLVARSLGGGEWELLNLVVAAPSERQGRAAGLLAFWMNDAGPERIFLEVRASNVAARALYERLGFVEAGRRRLYYEGSEDALVLVWGRPDRSPAAR